MATSPDNNPGKKQKKRAIGQKIILFIGAGAFVGGSLVTVVTGIWQAFNEPLPSEQEVATSDLEAAQAQLAEIEQNLLLVLEREPNNPNALQELVRVRLELGNLEGTIEPLDKLITIFPNDQVLKDLRAQIEQNLARTEPTTPEATEGTEGNNPAATAESEPNEGTAATEDNVSPLTPPPETP